MKRILTLVMTLVLGVCMMTVSAFAAGTGTMSVSKTEAERGETAVVTVAMTEHTGVAALQITPVYDATALELVNFSGTGLSGWIIGGKAVWVDAANTNYEGDILTFEFKVKDGTPKAAYPVTVEVVALDVSEENVAFTVEAGEVNVICEHTPGDEATCTTDQTCTKCGDILVKGGHKPGAAATCKDPQTCTECGEIITPATGVHTPGAEATCKNPQTCTVCGTELKPVTGEHTPGAEATCKNPQTCTVCGTELEPATGEHTPGEEATCTAAQTCKVCGDELAPKKPHTPGAAATCKDEQKCTVCGTVLAGKTGHNYRDGKCKVCGKVKSSSPATTPVPTTADNTMTGFWMMTAIVSTMFVAVLCYRKKIGKE